MWLVLLLHQLLRTHPITPLLLQSVSLAIAFATHDIPHRIQSMGGTFLLGSRHLNGSDISLRRIAALRRNLFVLRHLVCRIAT